jgi:PST family polysaccharide transporter
VPSLRQKAIKGVLWSAVQHWGSNLISTVVFLILANLLNVETFGILALATVFTAFLAMIQRQGFGPAIVQRADLRAGHLDTAFWTGAFGGWLLGAAVFATAGLIAGVWGQPRLGPVLQWLSITVFVDALGATPQALLRRELAFKKLAARSLTAALAGGVVGVAMALAGFGLWSLVGQRLASSVAGTIAVWTACRWRPGGVVGARYFKDLFGFGMFAMGNDAVAFFNRRVPDLFIGTFLGAEALGFYTAGYRLVMAMTQLFMRTVSGVALPTFSRLQHDYAQMRQAILTAARMTSLLAVPAFLGAVALAPELVVGLMGEKWIESIRIMQILALIGLVRSISFFNRAVIIACGKPSWVFSLTCVNALANIVVFSVAVRWGIVVVAAAYVIRAYAYAPFPLYVIHKLIGLDIFRYLRQSVVPLIASLVMILVVWMAKRLLADTLDLHARLAVSVLTCVVVYTLALRLIVPGRLKQAGEYVRLAFAPEKP